MRKPAKKMPKVRNISALGMILTRKVSHPMRDKRERRAKDARRMRELFQ